MTVAKWFEWMVAKARFCIVLLRDLVWCAPAVLCWGKVKDSYYGSVVGGGIFAGSEVFLERC